MKLIVDGIIFQKSVQGGIVRMYREILPRMCDLDSSLEINLLLDGPIKIQPPEHPNIFIKKLPNFRQTLNMNRWTGRLITPLRRQVGKSWNYARRLWIPASPLTIWHSTFYTFPRLWRGFQVLTLHDMVHEKFSGMYKDQGDEYGRQQKRSCIHYADVIICVSVTTRNDYLNHYESYGKRTFVIPNAASDVFIRLGSEEIDTKNLPSSPFFLYVGNRAPHKNFFGLLQAFSKWDVRGSLFLVVVGPEWKDEEIQYIKSLGIYGSIILFTNVDDITLRNLYNKALALVYPSLYEGFGIPLLEAFACGCPVVASKIPSTIELGGDVPFYFDPDDSHSLITAFERIISEQSGDLRIENGLRIAKRYSWDNTASQTLNVYRSLLVGSSSN